MQVIHIEGSVYMDFLVGVILFLGGISQIAVGVDKRIEESQLSLYGRMLLGTGMVGISARYFYLLVRVGDTDTPLITEVLAFVCGLGALCLAIAKIIESIEAVKGGRRKSDRSGDKNDNADSEQ